jgi:MbtH protein
MSSIDDDSQVFLVVVNDEGQYSIWPDFKALPAGWRETGFRGLKKDCLAHIAEVWTDMRPLSLQRRMDEGS